MNTVPIRILRSIIAVKKKKMIIMRWKLVESPIKGVSTGSYRPA